VVAPVPGPLSGVLVLDFSRVLAGPFATMIMSDLGARVIKVERPGLGDDTRGYGPFVDGRSLYFARVNRGKQSVAVDLGTDDGRALICRIAARADVVVENFRPGVMARHGLGYDDLAADHPGLVYASISGFGQTGPWRDRPAYDAVIQSLSGLLAVTGRAGEEPVKPGAPIGDLSAGLYAFGGICAALLSARATGVGCYLDVAMYDTATSLLEGAALRYLATGNNPPLIGNAHHAIAPFDTYLTQDGRITICAANDALWGALCATLGAPHLLADPCYASNALRHQNLATLGPDLEIPLAARTTAAWVELLQQAGVPCGVVATVGEALTSPQAVARQAVITAGGLPLPGQPLKLSRHDDVGAWPDADHRPAAPDLDGDGASVRSEFDTTSGS
jgi:CoA:oxalate CoA-transferase